MIDFCALLTFQIRPIKIIHFFILFSSDCTNIVEKFVNKVDIFEISVILNKKWLDFPV